MSAARPMHSLSLDVEEFFQVANLAALFPRERWDEVPSRLDLGMERALDVLERSGARATFFFLGWIAERHPHWVRRCLAGGHEVQSHGYEHRFLAELGPAGLARDLERTEAALIAAGAPRPSAFRASTFTLTKRTWWAFDVLVERGYRWDSSVNPIRHPDYGVPGFEPGLSRVRAPSGAGELVEFPVSTWPLAGRNWPVGGGGWLRLLPGALLERAFLDLERRGRPTALYLHPWELDPEQPRQAVPALKRFRHYLNLERTLPRLERLCRRLRFVPMGELLAAHGWLAPAREA